MMDIVWWITNAKEALVISMILHTYKTIVTLLCKLQKKKKKKKKKQKQILLIHYLFFCLDSK